MAVTKTLDATTRMGRELVFTLAAGDSVDIGVSGNLPNPAAPVILGLAPASSPAATLKVSVQTSTEANAEWYVVDQYDAITTNSTLAVNSQVAKIRVQSAGGAARIEVTAIQSKIEQITSS